MIALVAALAMLVAACGSDADDETSDTTATDESADTTATDDEEEPEEETDDEGEEPEEESDDEGEEPAGDGEDRDFGTLDAPTGEPMIIGMVNTEGPPGLNFPEIRNIFVASVNYLNEHGGMGGRPLEVETCISDASPEASQACAQELAGKDVEMVFLGLDLAPDYATYDASGIPVVGVLPLFPADYAADALYLNAGNVGLAGGIVGAATELFDATTVAIVSADNPGANGSEQTLIAALEKAGLEYRSIKGSDTETDAGFQGLVREAISDEPDVLVSLYGDAGCIGMMRGRAAIGSDIPVLAANTCANGEVIAEAGDDATGWHFIGGGERPGTIEATAVREAVADEVGLDAAEVALSDLGLGGLAPIMAFTVAAAANELADGGDEVTGQAIYDHATANESGGLRIFPDGGSLECGVSSDYPSVCTFTLFVGEYLGDGQVGIIDGYERFSVIPYLP